MARELGCFYLTRPDNAHAKAGNLNRALKRTHGDLIAIFDADHVPVRGFLRKTVGFFEDEASPWSRRAQHFFNPDPYERNLNLQGRIAPEQTFFYHVIQPGNDFWNSAFFCGSCAVLRRSAIESIGRLQGVNRHRGRPHRPGAARAGLAFRLPRPSPGRRSRHGELRGPRHPTHALGTRHGADPEDRLPALQEGPEPPAAAQLLRTRCCTSSSASRASS